MLPTNYLPRRIPIANVLKLEIGENEILVPQNNVIKPALKFNLVAFRKPNPTTSVEATYLAGATVEMRNFGHEKILGTRANPSVSSVDQALITVRIYQDSQYQHIKIKTDSILYLQCVEVFEDVYDYSEFWLNAENDDNIIADLLPIPVFPIVPQPNPFEDIDSDGGVILEF